MNSDNHDWEVDAALAEAEEKIEQLEAVADAARSVLEWLEASVVQGAQVDLLRTALRGVEVK